jgi:predicted deacylase
MNIPRSRPGLLVLAVCVLVLSPLAAQVAEVVQPIHPAFQAALDEQRPGLGVTRIGALSEYLPALAGTALDSPVYFLEPPQPAVGSNNGAGSNQITTPGAEAKLPAILILGGTHGDEIAGVMAASLFVSWAKPAAARLIVVPRANASAGTWSDPDRPGPKAIVLETDGGQRAFRYGSRFTRPEDEILSDPERYYPPEAVGEEQSLAGREARNLNRAHPGEKTGRLTARAAAAYFNLINSENVKAAFDLHEAGPVSGLAWNIIAHPKNLDYAAMGILAADERGVQMVLDRSRPNNRGLSHRAWGEKTDAAAYLIETLNPGQVTGGKPELDHLNNELSPLWKRVGIQVETVMAILMTHSDMDEDTGWAQIDGMPDIEALKNDFTRFF